VLLCLIPINVNVKLSFLTYHCPQYWLNAVHLLSDVSFSTTDFQFLLAFLVFQVVRYNI